MADVIWANALDKIKPYIFQIYTPRGYGSGFQIYCSDTLCGVATASHVAEHAMEWDEPIRIRHYTSKESIILKHVDRYYYTNNKRDLMVILFRKDKLNVRDDALELIAMGRTLKQGIEVGWCGFPAVAPNDLCFFEGHISSYLKEQQSYLVDGVVINGVSGGPAFYPKTAQDMPLVYGIVSAYIPSRAAGEALPGVCLIRSVQAFQSLLKELKSIDVKEKKTKKAAIKKKKTAKKKKAKKKKKTSKD